MLLWTQIQYLSQESKQALFEFYQKKNFPTEVRHHLALWIENNIVPSDWKPGIPEHEAKIQSLISEFIVEVARTVQLVNAENDFLHAFKLNSTIGQFQQMLPTELYQSMKDCLAEEMRLLQLENNPQVDSPDAANSSVIAQRVCIISNKRLEFASKMNALSGLQAEMRLKQEELQSKLRIFEQVQNCNQINGRVSLSQQLSQQINYLNGFIAKKVEDIIKFEWECIEQAAGVTFELEELVEKISVELLPSLKWSSFALDERVPSLDDVQRWYTELIDTILEFHNLVMERQKESHSSPDSPSQSRAQNVLERLDSLHRRLMSNVLVVDQQPSQVIKKETKFTASVRFLCGQKFLSRICLPEVRAVLVNEDQARALHEKMSMDVITAKGSNVPAGCGKIINNIGSKNSRGSGNRSVYQFNNLAIKEVRRLGKDKDKKSATNRAMTEKFCLVFYTELSDQNLKVWCCSIPFVFIVHVNQKLEGQATIFWDNSFRETNRVPFAVPDEVPWSKMAGALRRCFKQMTETQWNLTPMNLEYLAEKLFGHPDVGDNYMISRKKFSEKDSTSKVTFWEWFYEIMDLVNKHLKDYWNKGHIVGFIPRSRAEDLLRSYGEAGLFLLRFSDTVLGAVSLSYTKRTLRGMQVLSVNPFDDNELKKLSLAERLCGDDYAFVYHYGLQNGSCLDPCRTAKSVAFPPIVKPCRRDSGQRSVRLNYVPAKVVMIINPGGNLHDSSDFGPPEIPLAPPYSYQPETPVSMNGEPMEDADLSRLDDFDLIEWIAGATEEYPYAEHGMTDLNVEEVSRM